MLGQKLPNFMNARSARKKRKFHGLKECQHLATFQNAFTMQATLCSPLSSSQHLNFKRLMLLRLSEFQTNAFAPETAFSHSAQLWNKIELGKNEMHV